MLDSFTLASRWLLKPLDEDHFWTFVAEQKAGRLVLFLTWVSDRVFTGQAANPNA